MKIWLRFSTFSFFTALICEGTNYARAGATNAPCQREHKIYVRKDRKEKTTDERSYVFECCRDWFRFVLVLQVLVCNLKDILLFLPFLFILPHVTWGQNTNQHGKAHGRDYISIPSPLLASNPQLLCLKRWFDQGSLLPKKRQMLRLFQVLRMLPSLSSRLINAKISLFETVSHKTQQGQEVQMMS